MMRELLGDRLEDWMRGIEACDLPVLHSLTGINRDQDAVVGAG